jgi:nucleoid DNA-binding protein
MNNDQNGKNDTGRDEISGISDLPIAEAAVAAAPKVTPRLVGDDPVAAEAEELKKKELIDRVTALSGAKRRDVKPAVEAALTILGESLAQGRDVTLPGLGRMRVTRVKPTPHGHNLIVRVRQNTGQYTGQSADQKAGETPDGSDD